MKNGVARGPVFGHQLSGLPILPEPLSPGSTLKSLASLLCILVALLTPVIASAYYDIELNNGNRLQTNEYWQEGNETRFWYLNGMVGIKTSTIRGIEKKGATALPRQIPAKALATPDTSLERENRFPEEFSRLQRQFLRVELMNREELYTLAREMDALRDQVIRARRQGATYSAQLAELYTMFDKIEKRLKEIPH